ncbi:MAG: esterase family protein [Acidobacteria bacterium]|nr:esterase family protein [Acidobacteriota bacterium]
MRTPRSLGRPSLVAAALTLLSAIPAAGDGGRVLEQRSLRSEALGRDWTYSIYLPPDYDRSERAYPVVYLLHGIQGRHTDWLRYGDAAATADRLIASGEMAPAILVFPDGGDSYWIDSDPTTGFGSIERAFVEDLVPYVDANYRTIATRRTRAIGGLSMGGYGALRLAFGHPELFGAVAALSPAIRRTLAEGDRVPPSPAFGVPFDAARYRAASPFALLPSFERAAETLPLPVFLTAGDDDRLDGLLQGTLDLHLALRAAGLPSELRILDGGHGWDVWSAALPDALLAFSRIARARRR